MENITLPSPHEIIEIVLETENEHTFRVEWHESPVGHGQFFMLSIPRYGEAPISVSAQGDGYVEFTIRKIGKLTGGLFGKRAGDILFMRGPYGNCFPIDEFKGKHLIVTSGGTGLAPVRSTMQYFYDHPDEILSVHTIHGFNDPSQVLFKDDIKKFSEAEKFDVNVYAPGFRKGLANEFIPKIPFDEWGDAYNIMIVGPPAMFRSAAQSYIAAGAKEERIWVSFERKMACAVGKCGHCKINEVYCCVEGPVFNYTIGKNLID